MKKFTVALAGNPNTGKSSVFNALTGSHQHVGNWPGKTIEKKEGKFQGNGYEITVVDLPGTYSLTAFSPEEVIAAARQSRCASIAYTYTEPTVFFEMTFEVARLARAAGIGNVYVTNGYMTEQMLEVFHPYLDAANVDLKASR